MAVDKSALYVSGVLRGSLNGTTASDANGFVIKLNARTGQILWMTTLAGTLGGDDGARGIAVDGEAVFVAASYFGGAIGGGPGVEDAYIVRLNSTTGAISWYTTIATTASDIGWDVAVDGGTAFLVGTKGADAFVTALSSLTGAIQWSTTLATSGTDIATTVDAGRSIVHLGGSTTGAFPGLTNAGLEDAFHAQLNATTGAILSIDQFGTNTLDAAFGSALDGKVWHVVGTTGGSLAGSSNGAQDAWWLQRISR